MCWLHQYRREPEITRTYAETAMALANEHGFPEWMAWGMFHRGWAIAELGEVEKGVAEMEEGIAGFERLGGVPRKQFALGDAGARYQRLGRTMRRSPSSTKPSRMSSAAEKCGRGGDPATQRRVAAVPRRFTVPKQSDVFAPPSRLPMRNKRVVGAARDDEPRAAAREARTSRRGARDARRHLRLVHRGLRHRRFEGCQGSARRAGCIGGAARSAGQKESPARDSAPSAGTAVESLFEL